MIFDIFSVFLIYVYHFFLYYEAKGDGGNAMEQLTVNDTQLMKIIPETVKKYMDAEVNNIKYIGGGSNGKAYKCSLPDKTIVVKAFRINGMMEKEAAQLKAIKDNTSVKMPEIYFTHSDEKIALMGMGFIKGKNVLSPSFLLKSKKQKQTFADAVIKNLLEIHSIKGEKFGELTNPTYDSWVDYYNKEHIIKKMAGLKALCEKGKYSKKNYALLEKAAALYKEKAKEPDSPVLIHGDINIMNIMADPKTMKLQGFIDPAGYIYADREFDLFQLLNMWGNSFYLYETYKKMHPLTEDADFRIAFYGALNEASCRLSGGLIMPLWEILCNRRLKKEMKKYNL